MYAETSSQCDRQPRILTCRTEIVLKAANDTEFKAETEGLARGKEAFSFDGSGTSLEAFGVPVDLILAHYFKFSSDSIVTDQVITVFDNAMTSTKTSWLELLDKTF